MTTGSRGEFVLKIGEASAASGCHLETIRYYERIGLVPGPDRTNARYRDYRASDVSRLRFIHRSRSLGFSLDRIRGLLQLEGDAGISCDEVDRLARTHLSDIRTRIAELTQTATELSSIIEQCSGGQCGHCAILGALRGEP